MSRWTFPIPSSWLRCGKRGRLGELLRAIGAEGLTAHDLRGTHATHLLSGTWGDPWTIAEVASQLGDSITTTQRSYAHLTRGAARRAARGIRVGSGLRFADLESPTFYAVGHEGLEPSANGLRGLDDPEQLRAVGGRNAPTGSNGIQTARAYLEALAGGHDRRARRLALELARLVAPLAEDATAVLLGGRFWARHANRLAAALLEGEAERRIA